MPELGAAPPAPMVPNSFCSHNNNTAKFPSAAVIDISSLSSSKEKAPLVIPRSGHVGYSTTTHLGFQQRLQLTPTSNENSITAILLPADLEDANITCSIFRKSAGRASRVFCFSQERGDVAQGCMVGGFCLGRLGLDLRLLLLFYPHWCVLMLAFIINYLKPCCRHSVGHIVRQGHSLQSFGSIMGASGSKRGCRAGQVGSAGTRGCTDCVLRGPWEPG